MYAKIKPGLSSKPGLSAPPQSPSNLRPPLGSTGELSPPQNVEVSVQNLDSQSCDAERCNNHGKCVRVKGGLTCECEEGYSGDLCQNAGSSRTALALTLTFLFGGALMAAVIVKKRFLNFCNLINADWVNHILTSPKISLQKGASSWTRWYWKRNSCDRQGRKHNFLSELC